MTPDFELLATFARTNSEDAFAELVKRHVNLVYSAALRQAGGDAYLAQDVAQTVFSDLARKAGSLARRETLAGWLYTSAHFAAAKIIRAETRRRDREEKFMREPIHESAPEPDWETLRPLLDSAMHDLKEADRDAILLRYFENRQFAEVGTRLGLNENAARMRVDRALEKLRTALARRGLTATAALATTLSAHAVQVAPAGLSATLTVASITAASTGTLTLVKIMTLTKVKLAVSALVMAGTATAFVWQHQSQEQLRSDNATLSQQLAKLKSDNDTLSNRLASAGDSQKLSDGQLAELLKLRGEVGQLRRQSDELVKVKQQLQTVATHLTATPIQGTVVSPEDQFSLQEIHTVNAMKQLGLAMRIYANNNGRYATNFDQLQNELGGKTNFSGNISLDSIEFVNAGLVNDTIPDMIIFRERLPRRTPWDGPPWQRIYGLADGSVQTIYSDKNGSFDEFEKPRLIPPPNP
ncbi:MAG TPA: sigma-70 family RNA polymerase sigma factor [Candidatus Acidoferrales bacterium]|jgi:RNA polymerase sigma factor (sigma-70 family)|nr:sigma-70 family RNA polymerase sigma factor [Candidatus Acidoferrales bacterium]